MPDSPTQGSVPTLPGTTTALEPHAVHDSAAAPNLGVVPGAPDPQPQAFAHGQGHLHEPRPDLEKAVRENPGIHFRALARVASVRSSGALRTQLDHLLVEGRIMEVPDGRFKRFFVVGAHDPALGTTIARFSREVPHTIGRLLLQQPLNRTQLRRLVGCADSTLGYHLTRMVQMGDVERTGSRTGGHYRVRDEQRIRSTLLQMALDPAQPTNLLHQAPALATEATESSSTQAAQPPLSR